MDGLYGFICCAIFFISIHQIAYSNEEHCPCSKITIQDKNKKGANFRFKWKSYGDRGAIYQAEVVRIFLFQDNKGRWTISRHLYGSTNMYWTFHTSPCPQRNGQTWYSSAKVTRPKMLAILLRKRGNVLIPSMY